MLARVKRFGLVRIGGCRNWGRGGYPGRTLGTAVGEGGEPGARAAALCLMLISVCIMENRVVGRGVASNEHEIARPIQSWGLLI